MLSIYSGKYDNAPHGAICAALLPIVFEENVRTLQALMKQNGNLGKSRIDDDDDDDDDGGEEDKDHFDDEFDFDDDK